MSTSAQPTTSREAAVSPDSTQSSGHNRNRSNAPEPLGTPPIPPRTSSNQRSRHHNSGHTRNKADEGKDRSNRERSATNRDRPMDETSAGGGRSRRKAPHSPEGPPRATSANEAQDQSSTSALQSRSDAAMGAPSGQGALVKESSTIINQVVITDPAEDIERENARQLEAQPSSTVGLTPVTGLGLVGDDGVDDGGRGGLRSRHDYSGNSGRKKETTFGQYILGQTLGEGEFGKVKLGWKKDGSVQVAIKLIRRESLGSNPSRLPKIYREISILRDLSHPNIVRLHEMVETDRHIGIIMEYASGGELFDYILNNRYLKDNAARRLFAQLVSGVGYLHKKGIVHRDLKLENLLLDRNRNIIITDFGFANTFNPNDELGEEIEYNLTNREFVKRMRLDKVDANGMRRGDLMQTSCGSPCYAAPELVVSDSLYTGRKVDVWSCGVILYAMLAGYLPFDDDPANPEGDNINLLYKYIVSTPLTFPEYVTPHARDLLRRILVPDPRKRADLFEVARHSWLSEYSHIVSHITSSTTNINDIATTTVPPEGTQEGPSLTRSASVREPPKSYQSSTSPLGGLIHQQGKISQDEQSEKTKTPRDAKRRTVQVEYVPPQSQTARGEPSTRNTFNSAGPSPAATKTPGSRGAADQSTSLAAAQNKPLPNDPPVEAGSRGTYAKASGANQERPPTSGNIPRSMSESAGVALGNQVQSQTTRPNTGHSTASLNAGRLPSRGSYGQPVAPTVAATNAQGRLAQPKNGKQYVISAPIPQDSSSTSIGHPSAQQLPAKFNATPVQEPSKGHKRSNTVSSIGEKIFGRSGSLFGNRGSQAPGSRPKSSKRYPPTSMKEPYSGDDSRTSLDSRRSTSYAFNRKHSDSASETRPRRFSLLTSLKGFSSGRGDQQSDGEPQTGQDQEFARPATGPTGRSSRTTNYGTPENPRKEAEQQPEDLSYEARIERQFAELHENQQNYQVDSYTTQSAEYGSSENDPHPQYTNNQYGYQYQGGSNGVYDDRSRPSIQVSRARGSVLQKNRKFTDAYEYERTPSHHSGSSGAARKVMDFFRRRGKARAGEDR
ncbi:hypothetical protein VTN77DRAFT_7937 [Rasamsonia byssochlamydoides]|uniref:uncharacterized protein n=1 Tax=Rasamsonia byssochlamydoides TaxID=89139 RepID=UPI0037442E2D